MNSSSLSTSDQQQSFVHNNNRGATRLANPTNYHMQQMRYKESMGIDPTQMIGNSHLLFVQQQKQQLQQQLQQQMQLQPQQQRQESPSLSDLDYSELANSSPMTGELSARYRPNDTEYTFDEAIKQQQQQQQHQQQQQQQYSYAIQMKRSSTEVETSAGLVGHPQQQQYSKFGNQQQGYYTNSFENDNSRLKQFAGSAPSNMGFHSGMYSPFTGSDDMMSVAASQSSHFTGTAQTKSYQKDNESEIMDDTYTDDYSNQAK